MFEIYYKAFEYKMKNNHISIRLLTVLLVLFSFAVVFLPTPTPVYAATDLYWVGGNGSWSNTTHWSATSGGAGGAGLPNSTCSVHFDNLSFSAPLQVVTVDATANCLNMDWTGSLNNPTLNWGATIALSTYGDITFIANMNLTATSWGLLYCKGGATEKILTTNGKTLPVALVIGTTTSANIKLADSLTCAAELMVKDGTFNSNNQTVTCGKMYDAAAVTAKTLTLGTSVITCTAWDFAAGNLTLTDAIHTINISGTGTFYGGSPTGSYGTVNLNGTAHTISGSNTFVNLTRTGTATKTDTLTLTSGTTQIVTGTCALIGNSAVNRLLVQSSTLGTAATIHNDGNWTGTNACDFMDITSTHAVDMSNVATYTNYIGDCGGNTDITCTASDAQTSASTDTWATVAGWTGTIISRVPLPQDDVTCSHSKTVDMPRIGRSITFTGTPALTYSVNNSLYGSLTCVAGQTGTWLSSSSQLLSLRGRTALLTLTAAGRSFYKITMFAPSGTYTLQDALTVTNIFALTNGTWVDNGQTLTLSATTAISKWTANGGSITSTGTIVLANSGATGNTFAGNGLTYNNVTVQGAGAYALTVSGNNTFNSFTTTANVSTVNLTGNNTFTTMTFDRASAAKVLTLTAGTNTTVTDMICTKSDARWLTINATAPATLTKAGGGALGYTYISLAQNTGMPINTWYYTPVSVIGANVTNWILDAPPTVETIAPSVIGTITATGRGNVTSLNFGGNINEQGIWYDVDTGVPYANSSNSTVDVGIGVFTQPLAGLTRSTLYYFRSHATNDDGYAEGVESTFLTKPVEPNTFTCVTLNASAISCNWTKGDGALNTYIRYSNVTYPATIADGDFGYNGTLSTYVQTGLTDATEYYFRGWSWVSNATLSQFSDLYAGNYTLTSDPPQLATIPASNVEENTATTSATITYSPANYTVWGTQYGLSGAYGSWDNITGLSSTVPYGFNNNLVGLSEGRLYYYRGFAQNVAGIGYGSQLTFLTKPLEPTNLSVVNSAHSATLSWVKGTGALNTVIYGQAGSYPTLGTGTLVYNGTLATTTYTPPLSTEIWYYRAWSWTSNSTWAKYSDTYSEANAQGRMSDWAKMLIITVFLACMIMGLLWVMFSTPVSSNVISLMFTLVTFALIAFMGVAIINALL